MIERTPWFVYPSVAVMQINKEPQAQVIIVLILIALFLCVISHIAGIKSGINITKQEAIRANAAEWIADASGKPEFKWKIIQ